MQNRPIIWSLLFAVLICVGLAIDQYFKSWGQLVVDIGLWLVFAALLKVSDRETRFRFLVCLLLATTGELVLSSLFHFYTYRENNIPLFVPPGHVLLYASGLWLAPRVSKWLWLFVFIGASGYAGWCAFHGTDQLSLLLFALWCVLICRKPVRPLVSVMFLLALGLELVGTSLGNWAWAPHMNILAGSLTQNNPPFAAGVFYCALDFLVASFTPQTQKSETSPVSYANIEATN